jgi:hypothetical protein
MEVERRTRIGGADDAKRACDGIDNVPGRYRFWIFLGDMGRASLHHRYHRDAILVVGLRLNGWFVEELGMGERAGAVTEMRVTSYPLSAG